MEYNLTELAFEVTRRCNIRCEHCMRGEAQDIDMKKEYVDYILNNKNIRSVGEICFTGGEPTLNPDIIVYTINKIIESNMNVGNIVMVTNGQIFNKDIVDAFNRFNNYRNDILKKYFIEHYKDTALANKMINEHLNKNAKISLSVDKYHKPISDGVRENYKKYADGILIKDYEVKEIFKTGLSKFGSEFKYSVIPLQYNLNYDYKSDTMQFDPNSCRIFAPLYITANGYITTTGTGAYSDMDRINYGHISNISFDEIFNKYGQSLNALISGEISVDNNKTK